MFMAYQCIRAHQSVSAHFFTFLFLSYTNVKFSVSLKPPQHSKYKTYMCRDMKQKGGCPRGASCTFAHSQEELEK